MSEMDVLASTELGSLPSDWRVQLLGEVCTIKTGKKDVNEGSPFGKYPFFTCSKDIHSSDSYSFDTEAIMVAGNGVVGETKYFRGKFEAYQRTYVLDQFSVCAPYLFLFLKGTLVTQLKKHVTGSTMPYIRRGDLENIEIPIPPTLEQRKIAAVLGVVQRAIEQQERLLQLTAELKKTLLHQLFTQGLRGEPQKQTEIGPLPESWEVVELVSLFEIKHGFAFEGEFFASDGRYILLTPGHFFEEGGFRDQKDKTKFYTGDFPRSYLLMKGDLLVAMTEQKAGLLGSSIVIPESDKYLHNQRLGLIHKLDDSRLDMLFLYYFFNTADVRKRIAMTASGSKVRHTSPGKIRELKIALPSLDEQRRIVEVFQAVDTKFEMLGRKHAALTALFRTTLHQLMTAQIRVHDLELPKQELTS